VYLTILPYLHLPHHLHLFILPHPDLPHFHIISFTFLSSSLFLSLSKDEIKMIAEFLLSTLAPSSLFGQYDRKRICADFKMASHYM
jgi:hypothetical protein